MTEIVIASAARTAVGSFGGSLKDSPPTDLATSVAKAAIERAGIDAGAVDQAFFGKCDPYRTAGHVSLPRRVPSGRCA